jgi:prepilin-type N-terminal cleavage/methylation domain-containing protein
LKTSKGFTLIEVIMVVVIFGILVVTILPRFIELSNRATEGAARGALGTMRAAIAIQYAKSAAKGNPVFPSSIEAEFFPDEVIPEEPFSKSNKVTYATAAPTGEGIGWRYDNVNGRVWINHNKYLNY